MFEIKPQEKQASKKFYNKCSENSRSQIVFRTDIFQKLTLGAPEKFSLLKLQSLVESALANSGDSLR